MRSDEEEGALSFFRAQHRAFSETLAEAGEDMVPALVARACSSFEGNLAIQAEGQPEVACHKGCATCCTIRVVATAPEVLMAARYIRLSDSGLKREGIDVARRIEEADNATCNRSEAERVALRRRCPFIFRGICVIYPVRPLACRGHASHDKRACGLAAAGRLDEIPYSMPHMMVRSLVQNALQSALRDAGCAWAAYELNHALSIALADEGCEKAWMEGRDVFARAQVSEVDQDEMAAVFDRIREKS